MKTRHAVPFWIMIIALAVGCATSELTVKKVTSGSEAGIRYSLPRRFLLVTPSPTGDGSFTTELLFLADQEKTYAIDAKTKRGTYKLDVDIENGLLQKVVWNADESGIGSAAATLAGQTAKAELDRRIEEQKAADTAAAAAEAKLKELRDAVTAAKVSYEKALAGLKSARSMPTDDEGRAAAVRLAKLALQQAAIDLEAAQAALDAYLKQNPGLGDVANVANEGDAEETEGKGAEFASFWSPVLYEIVEEQKTIKLVAVEWETLEPDATAQAVAKKPMQIELSTIGPPKRPQKPGPPIPPPKLTPQGVASLYLGVDWTKERPTIEREFTSPIAFVEDYTFVAAGGGDFKSKLSCTWDTSSFSCELLAKIPEGAYLLSVEYAYKLGGETEDAEDDLDVQVAKKVR